MNRRDIIKGIIVLLAVTSLSGYLLAQVFGVTQPLIEEQRRIEEARLNREIFPEGSSFVDTMENGREFVSVYDSRDNRIGVIFQFRATGYGGPITIKAGKDNDGRIKAVRILEHKETPGLGARITDESFLEQFKRAEPETLYLKKDSASGQIDAVTGATISSRALTDAVREELQR